MNKNQDQTVMTFDELKDVLISGIDLKVNRKTSIAQDKDGNKIGEKEFTYHLTGENVPFSVMLDYLCNPVIINAQAAQRKPYKTKLDKDDADQDAIVNDWNESDKVVKVKIPTSKGRIIDESAKLAKKTKELAQGINNGTIDKSELLAMLKAEGIEF